MAKSKTFYFCVERSDITREYYEIESDEESIEGLDLDVDPVKTEHVHGEESDRWALTEEEFKEVTG